VEVLRIEGREDKKGGSRKGKKRDEVRMVFVRKAGISK